MVEEVETTVTPKTKIRFGWLDQFRGLVILLFIVQVLSYALVSELGFPVLAPHLNHGYKYASVDGWPEIVTLIDAGQQIFMFLVGFMAAFSVMKMQQKGKSTKAIWIRIARRFVSILILNVIHGLGSGDDEIMGFIFDNTLGYIAWAGFIGQVLALYVPKADLRFFIGLVPLVLQLVLSLFLDLDNMWNNVMGLVGIVIIASAFTGWMLKGDGSVDESSFKKRVLPVTFGSFLVMYLVEFVQWNEHHGTPVALVAMSVGLSGMAIYLFYQMEKNGYKIPILSPLGKNMLMVFLLEMVLVELVYLDLFLYGFLENYLTPGLLNGLIQMVLAGVVPIALMWGIAKIFELLGWTLRV